MTVATAPAPVASSTKRTPPLRDRVFDSREALDKAQQDGLAKGHAASVNRFKVSCNGKAKFVLSYNEHAAVGECYEAIGITVEAFDTKARSGGMTPTKMASKLASDPDAIKGLDDATRKALIAALTAKK